ncbi:MAG: glycosyltransferase [Actinomycetes bacterium]
MRRPSVALLVDATGSASGIEHTLSAAATMVIDGAPVQVIVVANSSTIQGVTSGHVVIDAPGATHGDALARGIAATRAERIVYVRAGVSVDQDWVGRALAALDREHGAAIIAGTVSGPDGVRVPALSPGLCFTGHPLPVVPAGPTPAVGQRPLTERTMIAGHAWVARRAELDGVNSFDLGLDQPFAGIDLAWRLWLAGREVLIDRTLSVSSVAPTQLTPQSGSDDVAWTAAVRAEVDALAMLYRNFDDVSLAAALPAALELSRLRLAGHIPTNGVASPVTERDSDAGVRAFTSMLAVLEPERAARQKTRRRPDAEVLSVLGPALVPDTPTDEFRAGHEATIAAHPELSRFGGRRRIVVATADSIASKMAGPAIRAWRLAEELSLEHEVRLVSITVAELTDPRFSVEAVRHADVDELVEWCDVFVFQGWVMAGLASFRHSIKVFVADIYDPLHLEQLEQARDDGERIRRRAVRDATAVLNEQLLRGDFFLCASGKQRDLWLGHLASLGRVNPATYDADPSLDSLIAIVPFGIADEPPERTGPGIRGVIPGIGPDDAVVLWGGGVYNWFDPLTLITAIDQLRHRRSDVRLVFLGMRHPNADIPEMRMAIAARELSDQLGLTGIHVFFNEEWVPYGQRQNFLLDADVAVTTHFHHVETDFSFRTRVLDYFWATLPTVTTTGDSLAELIEHRGLGIAVVPQDPPALADALGVLLEDHVRSEDCKDNIRAIIPELVWTEALRPLVDFCRSPRRAPDLMEGLVGSFAGPHPTELTPAPRGVRADLVLARQYIHDGGLRLLLVQMGSRIVRVIRR